MQKRGSVCLILFLSTFFFSIQANYYDIVSAIDDARTLDELHQVYVQILAVPSFLKRNRLRASFEKKKEFLTAQESAAAKTPKPVVVEPVVKQESVIEQKVPEPIIVHQPLAVESSRPEIAIVEQKPVMPEAPKVLSQKIEIPQTEIEKAVAAELAKRFDNQIMSQTPIDQDSAWHQAYNKIEDILTTFEKKYGIDFYMAIPVEIEMKDMLCTRVTNKFGESISHGKIIGNVSGKVWNTVQSVKKQMATLSPNTIPLFLDKVLTKKVQYTRAEKLNIVLELAADKDLVAIQRSLIQFIKTKLVTKNDMKLSTFAELQGYSNLVSFFRH